MQLLLALLVLIVLEASITLVNAESCGEGPERCVLPRDESLCRMGYENSCLAAVCYGSEELYEGLDPEEYGFLGLCYAAEGFARLTNCKDMAGATDCYGNHGINVTDPVRGGCEAGGCCKPELPLCELEQYFFFMSLAYGVDQSDGSECDTSLDYFGDDTGCSFLTDGKSNDAIVCLNAGITNDNEGHNYCDITFSGTNDAIDIVRELFHVVAPATEREITFGFGENQISFMALEMLANIALGKSYDENDGIVEIAFQTAEGMGCFQRKDAAVHLMGHSLGAAMANFFALKMAALYPQVHVKMTTAGEPSILLEPLEGKAAALPVWSNKVRYINGRVLPREPVLDNDDSREYGIYQDYCWVSQVLPGGHVAGSDETEVRFLCEVKNGGSLEYFIANEAEGCAAGIDGIQNDFPDFPHEGGLKFLDSDMVDLLNGFTSKLALSGIDTDLVNILNVVATAADTDFAEAFYHTMDLHHLRRSMHVLNLLYDKGATCDSDSRRVIKLPDEPRCFDEDDCFSGGSTVQVLGKGAVKMSDLEIGDMVMTGNELFEPVDSFGHKSPAVRREYLQIHATDLEKALEISQNHLLFTRQGLAVPASAVSIGDKLLSGGVVTKIKTVTRVGAYAPFTTSGRLVVNGAVVSSYISLQENSHVLRIGDITTPFTMHWLAHVFLAPFRLWCRLNSRQKETYAQNGISYKITGLYAFGKWLMKQNSIVMTAVFIPTFAVSLVAHTAERILVTRVLLLLAAVVTFFLMRRQVKQKQA